MKHLTFTNSRSLRVPSALRCAACFRDHFQPFRDDGYIVVDIECPDCCGVGIAPIPPAEVGL